MCYKDPTEAAKAKQNLQGTVIAGSLRPLTVNYYEIKEERVIQNEEAKDKADWERYIAQQTGTIGMRSGSLGSHPRITALINQLLSFIRQTELGHAGLNIQERAAQP